VRTSWDGDLRLYTLVDGLPLDGMQEVWGSNPHSSTGQRHNSKAGRACTAAKYCNRGRWRTPRVCSDPGTFFGWICWQGSRTLVLAEAVKLVSCGNALVLIPLTLAAHACAAIMARHFQP
jgi:hypothetical protein